MPLTTEADQLNEIVVSYVPAPAFCLTDRYQWAEFGLGMVRFLDRCMEFVPYHWMTVDQFVSFKGAHMR